MGVVFRRRRGAVVGCHACPLVTGVTLHNNDGVISEPGRGRATARQEATLMDWVRVDPTAESVLRAIENCPPENVPPPAKRLRVAESVAAWCGVCFTQATQSRVCASTSVGASLSLRSSERMQCVCPGQRSPR